MNPRAATHPSAEFLTGLFEPNDLLCATFIDAKNGHTLNRFIPLEKAVSTDTLRSWEIRNSVEHVYVSMAPFKKNTTERKKENVSLVRHVFVEIDTDGDQHLGEVRASVAASEVPEPAFIIQSSPHKYQVMWNVEGVSIPEAEDINRGLVAKFGGDPHATDVARVLRVPGFKNLKPEYDPTPVCEIVQRGNRNIYSASDFKLPIPTDGNGRKSPYKIPETIPTGKRNDALFKMASAMRAKGMETPEILDVIEKANQRCPEPLPKSELEVIASSAAKYPAGTASPTGAEALDYTRTSESSKPSRGEIVSVRACDVVPVPIDFLWEPYLQANALNAYYGNPAVGKGFTAIDNIACLTTGRPFPTESITDRKPMHAVVLAAEEGDANTIVPRLMAAGADLEKVRIIKSIKFHEKNDAITERLITFQQDMVAVKTDLQQHSEERFLVIDPITSYVGDINFNQDGEVRPVLDTLTRLAEDLDITILIVGHFNKNTNVASALDKPGGGRAWVAVPRTVWGFFRFPSDRAQRAMVNLKLNNAKESETGLLFTIGGRSIGTKPNGKPWDVGFVQWGGTTESSADEIVAAEHPEARRDNKGVDFLTKALKSGVRLASDVYDEGDSEKDQVSERTLKRACATIGVLKFKMPSKGWFWQHPSDHTPIPDGAFGLNKEAEIRRAQQKRTPFEPPASPEGKSLFSSTEVAIG
jgi:hypothetical protein